jgi:hypothetical protein
VRVFCWKILLRIGYDDRGFLLELLPEGSAGAEIGVWQGDFSAKVLATVKPRELHLIDPWSFNADYPQRAYGGGIARHQGDMDAICEEVVARFEDRSEVTIHRATSASAASRFSAGQLDWVYIDGDHSEEAVYRDLELYLPIIKVGGYLAGDDYEWINEEGEKAVKRAVDRFLSLYAVETKEIKNSQFVLVKLPDA